MSALIVEGEARRHEGTERAGSVRRLLPWLLVLAGAAAWANSLAAPFVYDDAVAIVENRSIRRLWPPWAALRPPRDTPVAGRPVVNLTFAANYAAGELDVRGYRAVNIAIHVLCALVLYGIVRRTTGAEAVAFAAALLWMLHPVQTESVTYVTQRTESLMSLFYLLTLYCAIRAWSARRPAAWACAAVGLCALGMATKESMVTAPLMVALYDLVYGGRPPRETLRRRRRLYAGLAATWIVLAALMASGPRSSSVGFGAGVGAWQYLLNQGEAVVTYLRLIVWPHPLVLDYGFPRRLGGADAAPELILAAAAALASAALFARYPRAGYPAVWFFVLLAPTSSVVPIATEVAAERRMYLALAGPVVLAVAGGAALLRPRPARLAGACAVGAVAVAFGAATWLRNDLYRRPVALWRATVEAVPANHRARTNFGIALAVGGRLEEAERQFRAALAVDETSARAAYNLANVLIETGRGGEAAAVLRAALRHAPDDPDLHRRLGATCASRGELPEAAAHLRAALRRRPRDAAAHYDLAKVLAMSEAPAEALAHFREAIDLRPGWADALRDAAWMLATHPDPAVRDPDAAVHLARRAAAVHAGARVLDALAAAYASAGDFEQAVAVAERAAAIAEPEAAKEIRQRLAIYREGRAYRVGE